MRRVRSLTKVVSVSQHNNSYVFGSTGGCVPIVKVVLELAVADAEHKIIDYSLVLKHLSEVEDIEAFTLCHDEQVFVQVLKTHTVIIAADTVVGVGDIQDFVFFVV